MGKVITAAFIVLAFVSLFFICEIYAAEPVPTDLDINNSMIIIENNARIITGTVVNNSEKIYDSVSVCFNLYDSDGNLVGNTVVNANNLEPHSRWKFKTVALPNEAFSFKFMRFITNPKLQDKT